MFHFQCSCENILRPKTLKNFKSNRVGLVPSLRFNKCSLKRQWIFPKSRFLLWKKKIKKLAKILLCPLFPSKLMVKRVRAKHWTSIRIVWYTSLVAIRSSELGGWKQRREPPLPQRIAAAVMTHNNSPSNRSRTILLRAPCLKFHLPSILLRGKNHENVPLIGNVDASSIGN